MLNDNQNLQNYINNSQTHHITTTDFIYMMIIIFHNPVLLVLNVKDTHTLKQNKST